MAPKAIACSASGFICYRGAIKLLSRANRVPSVTVRTSTNARTEPECLPQTIKMYRRAMTALDRLSRPILN
jgi:hypothetical protein